jgi:hypothetical protein
VSNGNLLVMENVCIMRKYRENQCSMETGIESRTITERIVFRYLFSVCAIVFRAISWDVPEKEHPCHRRGMNRPLAKYVLNTLLDGRRETTECVRVIKSIAR